MRKIVLIIALVVVIGCTNTRVRYPSNTPASTGNSIPLTTTAVKKTAAKKMTFVEFRTSVMATVNDVDGGPLGYSLDKFYAKYGKPSQTIQVADNETYLYYNCSDEIAKLKVVSTALNLQDKILIFEISRGY